MEEVILVDHADNELGTLEKLQAHEEGHLHRAFSVFIFNSSNELLVQKRAASKYHSGGLWSNSCCSHPRPGEPLEDAATRRLFEELQLNCELTHTFSFEYNVAFDNGLIEHELDHVFVGVSNQRPLLNLNEVSAFKYQNPDDILRDMEQQPNLYTEWFKLILQRVWDDYKSLK